MNMIVASSNAMATIMASSNTIAMILIKTVINRVVVRKMFQRTLIYIINRSEVGRIIVVIRNTMTIIIASSNAIAMIIIMPVINGVVVWSMGVTLSMVSLIAITMTGVAVRGGRMIVLIDITLMGILLSA